MDQPAISDQIPYTEYPPHDAERFATADGFQDENNTNGKRATLASRQVDYTRLKEDSDYADLITCLLHLAHSDGHNPFDIYAQAIDNFDAEAGAMEGYPLEEEVAS